MPPATLSRALFSPTTCRAILFLLAVVTLPACARDHADLDAGARFGAAAATLADTAEAELLHIRRQVLDLRSERAALQPHPPTTTGAPATSPHFAHHLAPDLPLDAGLQTADAEARLGATRALATFGALLTLAAADVDTREPASRAIDALRLHGLAGAGELSDVQAGALADLADAVARHTLASRRADVVRAALLETEAPVRSLAAAIRADFDPVQPRWLANLLNEHAEARLLLERLEAEASQRASPDEPRLARARVLARRAAHADAEAREAAQRLRAAADAMLHAHETLLAQLRADHAPTLEDIDAFLTEAERLKLTWHILRAD